MAAQINLVTLIPWAIFGLYWTAAFLYEVITGRAKRSALRQSLLVSKFQDLFLGISMILIIEQFPERYYPLGVQILPNSALMVYTGLAVTLIGFGFAAWARKRLGSNWSGSVQLKEDQTLVTTGPYAIVRHPIYAGIILAMIGSAISIGTVVGLIAILCGVIFSLLRIFSEERLMQDTFGEGYAEYRRRVKTLIPGIW